MSPTNETKHGMLFTHRTGIPKLGHPPAEGWHRQWLLLLARWQVGVLDMQAQIVLSF
jgi:hypothetical protein